MRTASSSILETLAYARQVVAYAERIGFAPGPNFLRAPMHHLGAILADSVLQAGINHKKIVRPRIDRIQQLFPEAAILSGIIASIDRVGLSDFLLWHHPAKPARFMALVELLRHQDIENVRQLQRWLLTEDCRHKLLAINGIGPKTVDYVCALAGHDCVAVDDTSERLQRRLGSTWLTTRRFRPSYLTPLTFLVYLVVLSTLGSGCISPRGRDVFNPISLDGYGKLVLQDRLAPDAAYAQPHFNVLVPRLAFSKCPSRCLTGGESDRSYCADFCAAALTVCFRLTNLTEALKP